MKIKNIKEFYDKYYMRESNIFLNEVVDNLNQEKERIIPKIKHEIELIFQEVIQYQKKYMILAGWLQISLLYTSIFLKKPKIRLELYDEQGLLGRRICYKEMDASWMFERWEQFEAKLLQCSSDLNEYGQIKKEDIRLFMFESLDMLVKILAAYLKYPLASSDSIKGYYTLEKSEVFGISVGGYLDWQKTIFLERPEVDIFFNPNKSSLVFQKYSNKIFYRKKITELDLRNTRFTDCQFLQCKFINVNLSDTVFIECVFEHITTDNIIMYGTTLQNCRMVDVDYSGVKFAIEQEVTNDIYKSPEFIQCEMKKK